MDIVKGLVTSMRQFYNDINPATLTGAIDVIVIEHENGDFVSTPFHVRFGKINVMNFVGKTVEIYINGEPTDLRMKLGPSGEAFFVEASESEPPEHLATSPIPDHPLNDLSCSPRKRSGSSPAVVLKARVSTVARKLVEEEDSREAADRSPEALAANTPKNEDEKSNASERSAKSRKRRRRLSKPQGKNIQESSSSDVDSTKDSEREETQFPFEVEDQSSEMKTAKTTQQNQSTAPVVAHKGSEGGKLKEPSGNNTSNTTVTSDDEFNWTSVASGVASARLTPMGRVVGDGDISDVEKERERPPSPAKSDTLVELGPHHHHHHENDDNKALWLWGELPVGEMPPEVSAAPVMPSAKSPAASVRNAVEPETASTEKGLYLDDVLAQTDPEMRKIYIGSCPRNAASKRAGGPTHHLEDGESGNGPSLSQSPQSGLDSDCEHEMRHPVFDYRLRKYSDLAMSLCGLDRDDENMEDRFLLSLVTYDDFCQNPDILNEPGLVFRMNGKYYNWKSMAPQLLSLAMFQTALPKSTMEKLCAEHLPKKKTPNTPQVKSRSWWWSSRPQEEILQEQKDAKSMESVPSGKEILESKDTVDGFDAKSASDEELLAKQLLEEELHKSHNKKSLRLSSDQLKSLGLQPGANVVDFKVITAYQGTSVCSCHIYLWKSTDRVVISDIDGTITKSDVLGHILPIIGNNWAQSGVTSLFNKIVDNGYKMIYLSARAIGQAHMTRGFLRSIKQDNLMLPDGPVLLNPTSLLNALHREVVAKNPHVFKINCLKDVKQLFNSPEGTVASPFYAGFGNKTTDALSYKTVSVPVNRIFTINHKGEISQELMGNVGRTYHCLGDIADLIFPYVDKDEPQEGFNSFSFWKDPLPSVEIEKPSCESPKPVTPQQPSAQQQQTKEESKDVKDSKAASPKKTKK